jgi:hypothetical protein
MVIYQEASSQAPVGLDGFTLTSIHGTGEHGHDAGYVSTFTFANALPSTQTSGRRVLIGTQAFADLNIVTPDYVVENQFIPQQTGSLSVFRPNSVLYDSVAYDALPSDNIDALYRDGEARQNMAVNFAGQSASVPLAPPATATAQAVEYYYADWDYYFVTAFPSEIALLGRRRVRRQLEAHRSIVQRVDFRLGQHARGVPLLQQELCSEELALLHAVSERMPNGEAKPGLAVRGDCLLHGADFCQRQLHPGTIPLYRLYNNGKGGAPNHRYTTSQTILNQMLAAGWVYEGNGITRAFACLPQ